MQLLLEALVNIKEEAHLILKTVVLLDQKYGINYITRILRASENFGFREENHRELETYGSMKAKHSERIRNLISYLLRNHFLQVTNSRYGSIGISRKGEEFLAYPSELIVKSSELRTSPYDKKLLLGLRQLRNTLARQEDKPPFRVFTDYTLARIIDDKPKDLQELKMIPGFGDYKANRFGPSIISVIEIIMKEKAQDDKNRFLKKVQAAAHQEVKALFESGVSLEEIAQRRSVQLHTVENYLSNLHKAGEIDLKPWIEDRLAGEDLEKGSMYFLNSPESSLKKAYEELGIDYDRLKLCKLYVSRVLVGRDEVKMAS
ncbi:MAG: RQC domain-containing protein [Bacteroidia bacterium]|nr:RQC domain-containing protein [Bacteroidia bacterium]